MRVRVAAAVAMIGVAGFVTIACGGVTSPSNNTTETFTGTVSPGIGNTGPVHPFTVSNTGEYTVKVTSLTPISSIFFGTVLGQLQGSSCAPLQQNSLSIVNSPLFGGPITRGNYCVVVYDVGTMTTAETYTMTVSHP
jgi:hypothetical protein